MEATAHIGFIIAAYTAAVIVVVGLTAWVMLDYRVQLRRLADLEKRGITRRSTPAPPAPAAQQTRG
jgi:heme exporter protein CcmD